jgi:hypothetical protein
MIGGMGALIDTAQRGTESRRRRAIAASLVAAVLVLALGVAARINQVRQATPVSAMEADRVVRLVGQTPWFTGEMVNAQDSTISYAGMSPHAHVIAARITQDVVSLTVQQAPGSGTKPAPVATVTLVSTAPVHGQSYSLISMAQGSITHRVEREGAGYRVIFLQQWGQSPCAYESRTIDDLPAAAAHPSLLLAVGLSCARHIGE